MSDTPEVWKLIFSHLKKSGFSVYSPGQHQGECTEPYVVVRIGSSLPYNGYTTIQTPYEALCYVPKVKFSTLESYVNSVEDCLKQCNFLRSLNSRTPSYYDEDVKGHMIATRFVNYRKM